MKAEPYILVEPQLAMNLVVQRNINWKSSNWEVEFLAEISV